MQNFIMLVLTLSVWGQVCEEAYGQKQQIDPSYLRQYYQQLQQQQQQQAQQQQQHQQSTAEATPIFESNAEQPEHYIAGTQQFRLKDVTQDQIRLQPQQHHQQQPTYVASTVREYYQHQPHAQQVQYQVQPQKAIYHQQPLTVVPAPRRTHPSVQQQQQQQHAQQQSQQQQYHSAAKTKYQAKAQPEEEEEDYDDQNSSYQFGFDVKDDEFTNYQNRKEVRDGGVIKGSYSVVDSDGFIRTVKYTADPKEGFKAEVIREPTDIVVKIPTPSPQSLLRHHAVVKGHKYVTKVQPNDY